MLTERGGDRGSVARGVPGFETGVRAEVDTLVTSGHLMSEAEWAITTLSLFFFPYFFFCAL